MDWMYLAFVTWTSASRIPCGCRQLEDALRFLDGILVLKQCSRASITKTESGKTSLSSSLLPQVPGMHFCISVQTHDILYFTLMI